MLDEVEATICRDLGLTEAEFRAGAMLTRSAGGELRFGGGENAAERAAPVRPGAPVQTAIAHAAGDEGSGEGAAVRQLLGLRAQASDVEVLAAIKELIRAASAAKAQGAVENAVKFGRIPLDARDWWTTQLRNEFDVALSVLNEKPPGVFTEYNADPDRATVDIDALCRQLHITRAEFDAAAKPQ